MDTSPEYIELCTKAEEIQNILRDGFDDGDFIYFDNESSVYCSVLWASCAANDIASMVWLPRQDQLLEMASKEPPIALLSQIDSFISPTTPDEVDEYPKQFKTMEQLLLAFVMKIKFYKYWTGTEWK